MLQSRVRRGELDRQITFIKKVIGSNSTNEDELISWIQISNPTVWAKVIQRVLPKEVVIADQIQTVVQVQFIIDYRTDLKEDYRVVYNTKVYNILGITEYEGSREGYLLINADLVPNVTFTVT